MDDEVRDMIADIIDRPIGSLTIRELCLLTAAFEDHQEDVLEIEPGLARLLTR